LEQVIKKLHEIKHIYDTYEAGLALYQSDVLDKFKKRKTEHLCFLQYSEAG